MKSSKIPSVKVSTDERERCRYVLDQVKNLELKVLCAYAKGQSREQVVIGLGIHIKTVEKYTTSLRVLCHNAWNIPLGEKLPNRFLSTKFAEIFQLSKIGNIEEESDESMISF